jgi:hypothetical protein
MKIDVLSIFLNSMRTISGEKILLSLSIELYLQQ